MEIRITTSQVLKVLQVISWILFFGLAVEAGGVVVNTFFAAFINADQAKNFWEGSAYLIKLSQFDRGHFFVLTITMSIVAVLKAILFYLILKLLSEKKLDMTKPFSKEVRRFILNISYLSIGIGLFSSSGANFTSWLHKQGMEMADIAELKLAGGDVWLFMAVILIVIVQIIKRGIEIQTENDLTI